MNSDYAIKWPKLRYHPIQSQLWEYSLGTGRFATIVAGRRSGKSEICKRIIVRELPVKKPWPNPLYYWVLPTREQAKRIAWDDFLRLIPKNWLIKNGANKTDLCFTTIFGSKLYLVGADKPERMEGNPADHIMIDESSDQKPGLYSKTVVPMLAERDGKAYRLGVPKRSGVGRVEFREAYTKGLKNNTSFHWKSAEILTKEQIAALLEEMTELDAEEQLNAEWQDIGSSVYYNFRNENIRNDFDYDPTYPIYVGCDFNVDPMCWTLGQYINDKLYIFDELFIRNTNTPFMMDLLHNKFRAHSAGWVFDGDATSKSRKTSATRSDYMIIKNDARFGIKKVFFPRRNPNCLDRYASVNKAFKNGLGHVSLYIHSRCTRLINDLNAVSYEEGTTNVEDYSGTDIGHMADALGYQIHRLMPYRLETTVIPTIHTVIPSVGSMVV